MRSAILGALGSIGLGSVWGWLIGSLTGRVHRPSISYPCIFLVTFIILAQVVLLLNWIALLFFLGAMLFALFMHVGWRRKLLQLENPQNFR